MFSVVESHHDGLHQGMPLVMGDIEARLTQEHERTNQAGSAIGSLKSQIVDLNNQFRQLAGDAVNERDEREISSRWGSSGSDATAYLYVKYDNASL